MSEHRLRFHYNHTNDVMRIRMGETELFMYKDRLLGLVTPDGTWRTWFALDNQRTRNMLLKRQQACGLDASWINKIDEVTMQKKAYVFWGLAYAEYARDRMMGAV
jgi:hypothetical protein